MSFLSNVSIKSNGNLTCIVELLILLLILNKLLKTNNFNSIVISVLIILFVVSAWQAFSQNNFFMSSVKEFLFYAIQMPLDNVMWYTRIGLFQLTIFKSLPSCYFKPTLNLYNFTSLLSAWILFLQFCNIAVNLGLTICGLMCASNYFSAFRYSWIIPSKITICLLFIIASHDELFI